MSEVEAKKEESEKQGQNSELKDSNIALSIRNLQEESMQISELQEIEKNYSHDVASLLKQLIEPMNSSFRIKPSSISNRDSMLSDVVLTPQGVVCLTNTQGNMTSKPLESLPSDALVRVIADIVPQIKQALGEKREKLSNVTSVLEKMAREFKRVAPAFPGRSKEAQSQMSTQGSQKDRMSSGEPHDAMKSAATAKP